MPKQKKMLLIKVGTVDCSFFFLSSSSMQESSKIRESHMEKRDLRALIRRINECR